MAFSASKTILIQEYFEPSNKERVLEIRNVLELNLNNVNIDYIYLLNEKNYNYIDIKTKNNDKLKQIVTNSRLTFKKAFEFCNQTSSLLKIEDFTIILANNDISFCQTSFDNINYVLKDNPKTVIALSRNEKIENEESSVSLGGSVSAVRPFINPNSQDVWIYRGLIKDAETETKAAEADFYFGVPGCDNRIAYILAERGYKLRNLPFDIITIHNHNSNFRTSSSGSIKGFYKTVDIEKIKSIKHIGSEVIVMYKRHDY